MKKRVHHDVHDAAGRAIGYVREWRGKWYTVHRARDGADYRCGVFADRMQALAAVAQADAPPA
jgi:hypothetical protein